MNDYFAVQARIDRVKADLRRLLAQRKRAQIAQQLINAQEARKRRPASRPSNWRVHRTRSAPSGRVYIDGAYRSTKWARRYAPLALRQRILKISQLS